MYIVEKTFKVCLFGESGVGKTSLTRRFLLGKYDEDVKLTLGAEIFVKYLEIDGVKVVLQIWDFAGEDSFKLMLPLYSQGSNAGIFMYDLCKPKTLDRMEEWVTLFREGISEKSQEIPILVVGGKLDRIEDKSEVKQTADNLRKNQNIFEHIQCSAKNGENVEKIFTDLTREIMKRS
jgi:small GTP-binding protein